MGGGATVSDWGREECLCMWKTTGVCETCEVLRRACSSVAGTQTGSEKGRAELKSMTGVATRNFVPVTIVI